MGGLSKLSVDAQSLLTSFGKIVQLLLPPAIPPSTSTTQEQQQFTLAAVAPKIKQEIDQFDEVLATITRLQDTLQKSTISIDDLRKTVSDTQSASTAAKVEYDGLAGANGEATRVIAEAQLLKRNVEALTKTLRTSLSDVYIKELREDVANLQSGLEHASDETAQVEAYAGALGEQQEALQERVELQTARLEALTDGSNELQRAIEQRQNALQNARNTLFSQQQSGAPLEVRVSQGAFREMLVRLDADRRAVLSLALQVGYTLPPEIVQLVNTEPDYQFGLLEEQLRQRDAAEAATALVRANAEAVAETAKLQRAALSSDQQLQLQLQGANQRAADLLRTFEGDADPRGRAIATLLPAVSAEAKTGGVTSALTLAVIVRSGRAAVRSANSPRHVPHGLQPKAEPVVVVPNTRDDGAPSTPVRRTEPTPTAVTTTTTTPQTSRTPKRSRTERESSEGGPTPVPIVHSNEDNDAKLQRLEDEATEENNTARNLDQEFEAALGAVPETELNL